MPTSKESWPVALAQLSNESGPTELVGPDWANGWANDFGWPNSGPTVEKVGPYELFTAAYSTSHKKLGMDRCVEGKGSKYAVEDF